MPANNPEAYGRLNPISILTALTGRQGAPTLPEIDRVGLDELNMERKKALGVDDQRAQAILSMIRNREVESPRPVEVQPANQQAGALQQFFELLFKRSNPFEITGGAMRDAMQRGE